MESTARFVANPVSAALYDERITDLAARMSSVAACLGE